MLTKPRDPVTALEGPSSKKRRFSPLLLIGISIPVILALIAGGVFLSTQFASHAAQEDNPDCSLVIPNNPLTAQGLATPYQLAATDPKQGACHEANANQSAFVQAAIIDPATGKISIYAPLVVDQGTKPAVQPVVPNLPRNAVVGIWFGYNANNLTLVKSHRARNHHFNIRGGASGNCVNGTGGSVFGQFAYCNAPAFFQVANAAIKAGKITVPALGTANDGKDCPTSRDFFVVDMDQSDNVQTQYLVTANGQTAQFSAANKAKLNNPNVISNPSDNALLTRFLDPALGCKSWQAPDLTDNNTLVSALPLDELQAAAHQAAPVALIPAGDPMVLNNGKLDIGKTNAYRAGVDQPTVRNLRDADTATYCTNLINVGMPRLQANMQAFQNQPSPDPGAANNLFTFLASRLASSLSADGINCVGLLKIQNPITLTTGADGVVTAATFANNTPVPTATTTTPTTNVVKGSATVKLYTQSHSTVLVMKLNYPNNARKQVTVTVSPDSCTGKPVLSQKETTDRQGNINAFALIRNVQGNTLPTNWFLAITDGNQIVGCGAITANGATGTVTLTANQATTTTNNNVAVTPTVAATTTTNNGNTQTTTTTPTVTATTTTNDATATPTVVATTTNQ
ncbi:hypothetical protein KSF_054940 [Reticulibacter mediterranei]|uniref:Uncharacterized protein n=1 Tax=Reticulibacter mediterranei TaxID=2778369 RepID=A0A8J3ISJ5_9CHLR|nr:hypothetical protein [Reticulibacter mediterranei]GHO95446.1 hypothetical protein KSF_054940 [Reticulibacter mediterranei]